jgi:asparagine synthase (glutamine-hydrolysing)
VHKGIWRLTIPELPHCSADIQTAGHDAGDDTPCWVVSLGSPRPPSSPIPNSTDESAPAVSRRSLLGTLLREHGPDAIAGLRGSFVALLANPASDSFACYRSLDGGTTIYWSARGNRVAVGSSAARVARSCGLSLQSDSEWLADYFARSVERPANSTPFDGVFELAPGQWLTWAQGRIRVEQPELGLGSIDSLRSDSEWVEAFSARLDHAVASTLPPQDQVAIMLSGGMDSGSAAVIAAERLNTPLLALSWRVPEIPDADEWRWIQLLSERLGIDVHAIDAIHHLPFSILDSSQIDADFPYFNPFRPLILECYRATSERGMQVILNGGNGDKLYPHPSLLLSDLIQRGEWTRAMRLIREISAVTPVRRLHRTPVLRSAVSRMIRRKPRQPMLPDWLGPAAANAWRPSRERMPEIDDQRHPAHARQLFGPYSIGGTALEQRFSQRYGIERRDPYLDFELRRLMLNAPHHLSRRDGTTKWIAREAMRGRMPEAFRTKPRTGLLNSLFEAGLRRHRASVRELLLDRTELWTPWVKEQAVRAAIDEETAPDRLRMLIPTTLGFVLWNERLKEMNSACKAHEEG